MIIMCKRMRSTSSPLPPPPPPLDEIITEDEILCSILSLLSLREAARTSVLSHRWRHLWTRIPNLEFNAHMFGAYTGRLLLCPSHNSPLTREEKYALVIGKTDEFIQTVDSVLEQRRGAGLDTFSVEYYLHKAHSNHLDAWLRLVVASKAKHLDLYLYPPCGSPPLEPYAFPCHLFAGHKGSSLVTLTLKSLSLKPPHGFDSLSNLKRLTLVDVDVTEEDISRLLSTCFTLDYLYVKMCQQLARLSISHSLGQLTQLYVFGCNKLREVEINASNLVRLGYTGDWVDFKLRESSQLKRAHFWFVTSLHVNFAPTKLPSSLPHLERLYLNMNGVCEVADLPKNPISFSRLTFLNWNVDSKMSLVCLASLLNVAPFLQEFSLNCQRCKGENTPPGPRRFSRLPGRSHTHLKTVKIGDFNGDSWQIEIAIYLLNNATELNSMTIMGRRESSEKIHEVAVEYLSNEVPVNVKFLTL